MFYSYILLFFVCFSEAYPLLKKELQPTSPTFSLIALHQGAQFQSNLVKFDGIDLKLWADAPPFFGRIKGNQGFVLNIPDATFPPPSPVAVVVDSKGRLTSNANTTTEALGNFGISSSLLTFNGSSDFLACPSGNYRSEYDIYALTGETNCPNPEFGYGYNITLLVQVLATVDYLPEN